MGDIGGAESDACGSESSPRCLGGWIMAMVDIAGAVPAIRQARSKVAKLAVDAFVFKQPVSAGDVLSFYAEMVPVGSTSMTVG